MRTTRDLIFNNGLYDYLNIGEYIKRKKEEVAADDYYGARDDILSKYSEKEIKKELEICKLKYRNIVVDGFKVLEDLESCGFSRGEIIGMLQMESIIRWKKIYGRLKKNPHFLEEKKRNIEKRISECIEQIETLNKELTQYRENNLWILRKINKLKIKLPFGLPNKFSEESYRELELEYELRMAQDRKERLEEALSKTNDSIKR